MKILFLSVKSFGKLSNVELNFNDGVNVISNANGFGKSTMAAFIRAMLYGFTYGRLKGATDASHYAPWGSEEKFGGSMTVEHNGETYRIERFFGKTAKSEQLSVTTARNNKQLNLTTSVGEFLLGLTADSYDRSAYFPQEAVELSTNDNFESKLANLVQNSDVDYDKAQKSIRDYRRSLRLEKGSGGKIYELTVKQNAFRKQLNDAVLAERRKSEIDNRQEEIVGERGALLKEQEESKKQIVALNKRIAATQPSQTDEENASKLAALEAKLSRVPAEIEQDKLALDELENAVSNVKNDVKPRIYPNVRALIAAIASLVTGIVLCAALPLPWNLVSGLPLIALSVCLAVISFRQKGAQTLPSGEKDALISQYFQIAAKYFYVNDLDYNGVKKEFWRFYSDYAGDKRELETLRRTVKRSDVDDNESVKSLSLLERKQSDVERRLTALASEEGRLFQERKMLNVDSITPSEQICRLDEQIRALDERYRIAGIASDLLAEAKESLSSSYLPRLCARCQELLCQISGRSYETVIDRDFNVSLRENGQTKSMSEFSRGTREITLLCFRVALSELLYDKAIPFVIIDDAFVNFDEENFVRATNLLKNIAKSGQVIYFTCHKRMGNLLK